MRLGVSAIVGEVESAQPIYPEQSAKYVLKHLHARSEAIQNLVRDSSAASTLPLEHPSPDPLLVFNRRKVSQGQEVFTFEVDSLAHELASTFLIDDPRHDVRKSAGGGISGSPRTDQVG